MTDRRPPLVFLHGVYEELLTPRSSRSIVLLTRDCARSLFSQRRAQARV
jgi:hypothetical protein